MRSDESAAAAFERQVAGIAHNCIVIGGRIGIPPNSMLLFEAPLNGVHKSAPNNPTRSIRVDQDTVDAAA